MQLSDNEILESIKEMNPNQVDFFDVNILTYTDEVRDMCKVNSCGRYGRSWNCPPGCGEIKELEEECKKYSKGILFNTVTELEDSFDWEGMMAGGKVLSDYMLKIFYMLKEAEVDDFKLMGSASCSLCDECTYPNEPCRNPDKLFVPIEACGINVMQTALDAGFKYINGQNTVTFFGMLLFN